MPFYDAIRIGSSAAADFEIENSLRFNGADGAYLERTPSSSSNKKKMTFSFWFKRAVNDSFTTVFRSFGNAENRHGIDFVSGGQLRLWGNYNNSVAMTVQPTQVFRDFSAWYHFVLAIDTEQGTASNRVKMYINGNQITDFATATYPAQNFEFGFNDSNVKTQIGIDGGTGCNFYMAEFHEIDGLQLTPSSFAETNSDTGQWVPIDTSSLTFGTNGFRLKFADNSGTTATTLGKDSSGNGNNFTPNNFVTGDAVKDTPTNNFPTWNPLSSKALPTLSEGNLKNLGDNNKACNATFGVRSGKWYWEVHTLTDVSTTAYIVASGVTGYEMVDDGDNTPRLNYDTSKYSYYKVTSSGGYTQYKRYTEASLTEIGSGGTFMGGTITSFRLDMDNGSLKFYTNNTLVHTDTTIPTDGTFIFPMQNATNSGTSRHNASIVNFGQDGTFAGNKTAQGNTDSGGIGNFFYAVPSGFKALCSANLPDPTILLPNNHFDTFLYTATGNAMSFSPLNFQPDWIWQKRRDNVGSSHFHYLFDSVRGGRLGLQSNTTGAEFTGPDPNITFTSNGYDMAATTGGQGNGTGGSYVSWNWNAGDAASKTYRVVVSSAGGSGNKYRFRNSANSATFAADAVTLDLEEGGTYTFDGSDSSMSSHPFVIGTAANGSEYSTGVTYQLDGASVTYNQYTSGYSSATTRKLIITVPASAPVLYYWCSVHSGMGGQINTNSTLGSSNFDGSLQSTVKANTTSGFSIVGYTGNQTSGATVGHGLGVAPKFIITKQRSTAGHHWRTYHAEIGATKSLYLDLNNAQTGTDAGFMNNTEPTSTVFSLGDDTNLNENGQTHIAYCFNEVEGYSKFGSYTGNGSTNGTFVFTGFRPAWVMVKRIDTTNDWPISDNKRSLFNLVDKALYANLSNSESTANRYDFLSNGFKIRNNLNESNASGGSYIYLAFAESPFKNSRAR